MKNARHPLVSVIVPVYNVERYLDCCLDSIRSQSYECLEIILVEDCSVDGSLSRLERHLADPRVRLIRHERNLGLSSARNSGIEAVTGDFVLFVDSDDAIAPTLIETCLIHAQETSADVVVFDFVPFKDGDDLPEIAQAFDSIDSRQIERGEFLRLKHFACLKFIRSDLLQDPRLRFPLRLYYEDWPFHWELGFSSKLIMHLGVQGYCYRQRDTSITASPGKKLLDQFVVQHIVMETVRLRGGVIEREVLSAKVYASAWVILMRIKSAYIPEAILQIRSLLEGLRSIEADPPPGVRVYVLNTLIALSPRVSVMCAHALRGAKRIFPRTILFRIRQIL